MKACLSATEKHIAGEKLSYLYDTARPLAEAGQSTIYLAEVVGRPAHVVVLKIFNKGVEDGRRKRERDVLMALDDPRIVQIRDVLYDEESRELIGIVLEYLPGKKLSTLLKEKPGILELLRVFDKVLEAVEAAHAKGVYHHDVKPENVMVEKDGRIILIDFGLAYMMGSEPITQAGCLMGTPCHMPPEMLSVRPDLRATPAGDIYGLGVILYELVTGRSYRERSIEVAQDTGMMGVRRGHITHCFGSSSEGDALEALAADMLNRVGTDRPGSVRDIRARFEKLDYALLAKNYIPNIEQRRSEVPRDTPTLMEVPSRQFCKSDRTESFMSLVHSLLSLAAWEAPLASPFLSFRRSTLLLLLASLAMCIVMYALR